jgi:phage terminase small subunit
MSPKQQAFVREYLVDLNATAAYKRAGYKGMGSVAENAASRLLRNGEVAAAIKESLAERAKRTEVSADFVVQETLDTYREARAAEKFAAAVAALALLGRHTGAFPNKHEISGPGGGAIPLEIVGVEIVPPAPKTDETHP